MSLRELGQRFFEHHRKAQPQLPHMDIFDASSKYLAGTMSEDEYARRLDDHYPSAEHHRKSLHSSRRFVRKLVHHLKHPIPLEEN